MVAEAPEQLREAALRYFREEEVPEALWWVEHLDSLHLRLFAVELADVLKTALITGDDRPLCEAIEGWEATASVMASPEVMAALLEPKDYSQYRPLDDFTE